MDLYADLVQLLSNASRVSKGQSILEEHGRGLTYHRPTQPDVVVFAKTQEDIVRVLRYANEHHIAVTPYGAGTSLEGHTIPLRGGISLDMTRMNQIVEVRPKDFLVRVQPGVTRTQLNRHLRQYGLQFPLDPGADATLGGMAATNASGTTAVRYGVMRQQVLDLEVVLHDGSLIRTGGMSFKSSAGYNLTGLFIGSEGTLGIITELTLKLYGIPEYSVAIRAVFSTIDAACEAAYHMIASGMHIGRVELVDEFTIAAVNRFKRTDFTEKPTLFLEFHGTRAAVEGDVRLVQEICWDEHAVEFVHEVDGVARSRLWEARHEAALAIAATAPGKKMKVTDVCVPVSRVSEAIRHARETIDKFGIYGAILGHVGDGNYHVEFMVDPENLEEMRIADQVNHEIVEFALARGGTCTGEHGVGIGKMSFLQQEHGSSLPVMRLIKQALDPNNILNPGKVVTMP